MYLRWQVSYRLLTCLRDGPADSSDDGDTPAIRSAASKNALFSDDPWNAMCVLGLRVYCENALAKVSVIKGENSS